MLPLLLALSIVGCAGIAAFAAWQLSATTGRLNLLILGLDRRPEQGYVVRSDTMVFVTVYPPGPRIALLSIPRDLYVEVPGYGSNRINTAHFWGENEGEGRGPELAKETVARNFGVPVQRFVRVDFAGFRAIVDAFGGIDVQVDEPIVDDAYPTDDYGVTRVEIQAGLQHMDGETALRYARSRHGSSDFDRAERQQQVILALASRALEPSAWPRLPAVFLAVLNHVETDIAIGEWLSVAATFLRLGPDGIEHYVISRDMTSPWTTPNGGSVLLPIWERIQPAVRELSSP